jgi:hypothetical protein
VIEIEQLRYVRLGTRNLGAAVDFAQRILGLQLIERTDEQATFRSDFRDHTLAYEVGDRMQQSVGLEVRTQAMLDRAIAALGLISRQHSYFKYLTSRVGPAVISSDFPADQTISIARSRLR